MSATDMDMHYEGIAPNEPKLDTAIAMMHAKKFPSPPKFDDKHKEREYLKSRLTLAFRIFGKLGFDEGVAGHITLRDPVVPHTFWVNPFGVSFAMMKSSDLILVDYEGNVLEGGTNRLLNTAAYLIHAAVHKARPDVLCAAHSHSIYGRAFCALGRNIDVIGQDSCAFYNDVALYGEFEGVVMATSEGENIGKALGNKKACLLQNHGLLTVGGTVEAAVFWFISLEKCCRVQLLADAAAGARGEVTRKVHPEEALVTYKSVGTPLAGWFSAQPAFNLMAYQCGDEYLQ